MPVNQDIHQPCAAALVLVQVGAHGDDGALLASGCCEEAQVRVHGHQDGAVLADQVGYSLFDFLGGMQEQHSGYGHACMDHYCYLVGRGSVSFWTFGGEYSNGEREIQLPFRTHPSGSQVKHEGGFEMVASRFH